MLRKQKILKIRSKREEDELKKIMKKNRELRAKRVKHRPKVFNKVRTAI